ncbi:hypothetical protein [Niabella beijingensis]|uniref:hypothetical protein n=1 Tax=Niabella beijingensis TaxID=2872700 RepID=UPI001CC06F6F|nr:hypothetical protein [Niabella beijingensis]MBZ4188519.1 hypothetical protein [Niabella beijingensis]
MNKKTTFFERLEAFSIAEGFKSINDFAINGLKYKSSQKLNRLRSGKGKPSLEIIEDIKNRFENADLNWLISNKGEKHLVGIDLVLHDVPAPDEAAPCKECELRDAIIASQKQTIKALQGQADTLQLTMEIVSRKNLRKNP